MITDTPVWCYWQGPVPGWISLCLQSLRKNVPGIQILTPDTWQTFRKDDLGKAVDRQRPNVISDFIRAHQLYHYGGIWVDADCSAFRDFRPIMHRLNKFDFVAYRVGKPAPQMCSALIASHAGGDIASEYLRLMTEQLRSVKNGKLSTLSLGPRLLPKAAALAGKTIAKIPTRKVHPIHWNQKNQFWEDGTDDEHAKYFAKNQNPFCCMLTHRSLGPLRSLPESALLKSTSLVGYLFRRSLGKL